jgi:hypothetical protein
MSSQPSTSEKIKQTANSAIDSVSSTASAADPNYDPNKDKNNFAKDDLGNKFKKPMVVQKPRRKNLKGI